MGNQHPGGGGGGGSHNNDQQQQQQQQQSSSSRSGHHHNHQHGGYNPGPPSSYPPIQVPSVQHHQIQHASRGGGYSPHHNNGSNRSSGHGSGIYDHNMPRSTGDLSMTVMDNQALMNALEQEHANQMNANNNNNNSSPNNANNNTNNNNMISSSLLESWLEDDTVPTVFRWEHGGRQVYITGTFNGWSRQIPMHQSGNDFTYIHNLKRGKHAFKFIVDDEWRFAPDQPTVADIEGRINNFIDVTSFKPYTGDKDFEKEKAAAEYGVILSSTSNTNLLSSHDDQPMAIASGSLSDGGDMNTNTNTEPQGKNTTAALPISSTTATTSTANKPDKDGEIFTTTMPDMDEYTKEPPPLPPHLRHIILNKPPQLSDTAALPVPQHVALNHLYCTAIKDNMMVLGITQRYKTKFVTTVYYSPCGK